MTRTRVALGRQGEDLACRELRRRNYVILERRFRTRHGEIDIVARDGATLVFVEGKARTSAKFGTGFEAVTWSKRRRLCEMAGEYLSRRNLGAIPCRFDLVAIELIPDRRATVSVMSGAFSIGD